MNPVTVAIVDDHPLLRQGLRTLLEAEEAFHVVAESEDGLAGLAMLRKIRPDIVILDISLPKLTGLELVQKLAAEKIPVKVVILTMHKDERMFNEAVDAGIRGYVLKDNAASDIITCLKSVAAGEPYLSPSVSPFLLRRRQRSNALYLSEPNLENLTSTERRVLKLVSANKTSKEIAAELFISHRTVQCHRANICSKLELRGSHRLLHFAIQHQSDL